MTGRANARGDQNETKGEIFLQHRLMYSLFLVGFFTIFSTTISKTVLRSPLDRIDGRIQIVAGLLVLAGSVTAISFLSTFTEFLVLSTVTGVGISLSTITTNAYVAYVAV